MKRKLNGAIVATFGIGILVGGIFPSELFLWICGISLVVTGFLLLC